MAGLGVLVALALVAPSRLEASWLRHAAELAGFRVPRENAAAWIVEGRGRTSFYLWATRAAPEPRPLFGRLAGVPLYGTKKVRVGWRAQGVTVWVEYGPRATATLPTRARLAELVLVTLRLPRRYRPIAMMRTPDGPLRKCRSSGLLAPACPRSIPRVPGWRTYPSYGNRVRETFGIESGGEVPGKPELNRPPSMTHVELTATRTRADQMLPFAWPRGAGIRPRDGLVRALRNRPVGLGSVTWAGKRGSLALAPPFPTGGSQGNHLLFRWREAGATYFLGLHAWEPFLETVSTLRRIVASIKVPHT